jgi:UDP-glucose 4-epimerase
VVGDGDNRYQFISAQDLIDAMLLAAEYAGSDLFGVGSDNPLSLKQIYQDFSFDTTRIKTKLQWQPKLTNEQMLLKAYQYFASNKQEIFSRSQASSHRRPAKMGVIRLLKWAS